MAQDMPPRDEMNYEAMAQDALRGVVKAALKRVAAEGLPGEHNFRITFRTDSPGVSAPAELLAQYPDEMTIALQHQFWDLAPGETFFSVTLKFNRQPRTLSIPYAAVTRFYDPYVGFMLAFDLAAEPASQPAPEPGPEPEGPEAQAEAPADEGPKIVSLDQFRKK